jgi:hypothetical protein
MAPNAAATRARLKVMRLDVSLGILRVSQEERLLLHKLTLRMTTILPAQRALLKSRRLFSEKQKFGKESV